MNDHIYSNSELAALRDRLNDDIRRRSTFTWWDPLVPPTVGTDREPRRVLPEGSEGEVVTDRTYTVNNTSAGSLEETRNIFHPSQGDNPGGQPTDDLGSPKGSATRLDQDEIRNLITGLAKMHDIDLFYGRDEKAGTAYRDPEDIQTKLGMAEQDKLHAPNTGQTTKYDPNAGMTSMLNPGYDYYPAGNTYTKVQQPPEYSSGQFDGEEIHPGHPGPDPTNFYDDYGAKVEGTKAKELTSADRQVIPIKHDSYQIPVQPGELTAELDLTPGGGKQVTKANLIDYTATSGDLDRTPSGKASGGWISTPGGAPAITLPGQLLKRSYNGGADRMVDTGLPSGGTTYQGRHPTTGSGQVNRQNNVPPLSYPPGAVGDQPHLAFHPQNPYVSPETTVYQVEQDDRRHETVTEVTEGHVDSVRFGLNPRNPQRGDQYSHRSFRQTYTGLKGLCHVACFRAGTMVETEFGPRPIEKIVIGDRVLTHTGKYQYVYHTFERDCQDEGIIIRAVGTPRIYTTINHPFWVKRYLGISKIDGKLQQIYAEPEWVDAKDISSRDKLCLNKPSIGTKAVDLKLAYMVGRWLGDGWKTQHYSKVHRQISENFYMCCSFQEAAELEKLMTDAGLQYVEVSGRITAATYYIIRRVDPDSMNKKFMDIISKCGKYSHGKYITPDIFEWNKASLEALIRGYEDSDGYVSKNRNSTKFTTVSKMLAQGVATILRMLGRNPSWYERSYQGGKGIIEGRIVNMRTSYTLGTWNAEMSRHYSHYDDENNCVWASVTLKRIPTENYTVYNLSVMDDETYYADGALVHNCTGMCYLTCDSECSESCQTTCWNRCGDACVANCSNVCTGCSTLCYSSCKTKCETSAGMSCLDAGAKTVSFVSDGSPSGGNGSPWPRNHVKYSLHSCDGCSFTCQFYANYRTTCWDALCQNMCFYSCYSYCSTSCYGGCVDNQSQHDFSKDPLQPKNSKETNSARYRTGRGQACREGCVADCVGVCQGSCDGECTTGCFYDKCVNSCYDTCNAGCDTKCGSACASVCKGNCSGDCNNSCSSACNSSCKVSCKGSCKGSCSGSES